MICVVCLTMNILDIILASYLSFMSIFVDRPNAKKCFVESELFDICSGNSLIFLRTPYIEFFFYIYCMTPNGHK